MITRVLSDYNNQNITADAWVASTRKRLAQADRALSGLELRTASITDAAVAERLRGFDRRRGETLTAFKRLLSVVSGHSSTSETAAQNLVNRRLRAYQRESQRLTDLMVPYLTDEQRDLLKRARGA
jgi:hypothetical protein